MRSLTRNALRAAFVLAFCAFNALPGTALAAWPDKPITMLVGFSAGGGADTLARLVAKSLQQQIGEPVVVQNRPGGGGAVMASLLKLDKPDGYTIGFSADVTFDSSPWVSHTTYKASDFSYLTTVTELQDALVASAKAPFSNWRQMVAYAKKNGGITFGSLAPQNTEFARLLAKKEHIQVRVVPLRGGRQVINDLLSGDIDVGWSAGVHQAYLGHGIQVIASLNKKRLKSSPKVPSITELGFDKDYTGYFMIAAPKGMPQAVHDKLASALQKAASSKEVADLAEKKMMFPNVVLKPKTLTDFIMKRNQQNKQAFSGQ